MNNLNHISKAYFIGIGGIGMSALAHYFLLEGKQVAGYDRTETSITASLEDKSVVISFKDSASDIPQAFLDKENTLIVYTPAIPKEHKQLNYFIDQGFIVQKRAKVLAEIANSSTCLAVAGTHGKTTTAAILGHLLAETGAKVTAFIGGITQNYASNLIYKGNDVIVVEADEFDRSFLNLNPDIACITSVDADHLDIYDNPSQVLEAFTAFSKSVTTTNLLVNNTIPIKGHTIGVDDSSDYSASNIRLENGTCIFDLKYPEGLLKDLHFNLPGLHNLSNAVTALGMAIKYGSPTASLPKALSCFCGVNRRFTYRIRTNKCILIDDYAHHPTEISAVNQSIKLLYPQEKILAVFQPHLFSRTRDFIDEFALALSTFDAVALLDIYPAREKPIPGITSSVLLDKITIANKYLLPKDQVAQFVKESTYKIVVMMGAGDIDKLILETTSILQHAS